MQSYQQVLKYTCTAQSGAEVQPHLKHATDEGGARDAGCEAESGDTRAGGQAPVEDAHTRSQRTPQHVRRVRAALQPREVHPAGNKLM